MKIIKNSILTFLVLLSITAVFANVSSDLDINGNPNVSVNHGSQDNLTFELNYTGSNSIEFEIDDQFISNYISINANPDSDIELNSSNRSTNVIYTYEIEQHTAPGEYNISLNYTNEANSLDFLEHNLTFIVQDNENLSVSDTTLEKIIYNKSSSNLIFSNIINNTGNLNLTGYKLNLGNLILNYDNTKVINPVLNSINLDTIIPGSEDNVSLTYSINNSLEYGIYTGKAYLLNSNGDTKETIILELKLYKPSYELNEDSNIDFKFVGVNDNSIDDITNDDDKTYPGDTLRISDIVIENDYSSSDNSIDNIEISYAVYHVETGDEILDGELDSFDLEKNEESEDLDIEFIIPYDAVEGDYIIELFMEGEIVDDDDSIIDGEDISNVIYLDFKLDQERRHIVPTSIDVMESCGTNNLNIVVDLTNIGTDKLDEDDEIMLRLKIPGLSIDKRFEFNESLRSGKTEFMNIELDLDNYESGNYEFEVFTSHKYDKESEDDGSKYSKFVKIECGDSISDNSNIMITGKTSEEGKSGSQTKYTLSLTNRKDIAVKYDLAVDEFNWGTAIINPTSVTLQPGATTSFDVFVMPGENAQESNSLTLDINQNGKTVLSKNLEMNLPQTGIRSLFGGSSNRQSESNPVLALLIIAMAYIGIREYKMFQKSNNKASKKRK